MSSAPPQPTAPLISRGRHRVVDDLNTEWAHLDHAHSALLRQWSAQHDALAGCQTLSQVLAAVRADPDDTLSALLTLAQAGDLVAGRVVLQAMLGKVVRMAGRDSAASADDYVAAMWCRILTYPLLRRPKRVAANLALDTLKAVTRERAPAGLVRCVAMAPDDAFDRVCSARFAADTLDNNPVAAITAPELIRAASRTGIIDADASAVLHSVYVEGLRSSDAAVRHRVTPEAVRYRCSRAVRRMASRSDVLLDAA